MQHQRFRYPGPDGGEALEVQARLLLVEAVGRSDGDGQGIDAGARHELGRLVRVGQMGVGGVHDEVILLAAELAQFCLHACPQAVAEGDDPLHLGDVLLERQVGGIDHGGVNAGLDLVVDILLVLVVVQMQYQRDAVLMGSRGTDGDQVLDPGVAVGTRRGGQDHRGVQFGGSAGHHLDGLQVVDVEGGHRIAAALGIFKHFVGRDQIHEDSLAPWRAPASGKESGAGAGRISRPATQICC